MDNELKFKLKALKEVNTELQGVRANNIQQLGKYKLLV